MGHKIYDDMKDAERLELEFVCFVAICVGTSAAKDASVGVLLNILICVEVGLPTRTKTLQVIPQVTRPTTSLSESQPNCTALLLFSRTTISDWLLVG